jgi:hypothetical protein
MSVEFRPDPSADSNRASTASPGSTGMPLQREAEPPRKDRWLMPLIAAGCTLAGVAMGFTLGTRTAQTTAAVAAAPSALATRLPSAGIDIDLDLDEDDMPGRFFAFNWHGHERHRVHAPIPPMPPMPPLVGGPRELVVDNCGDDDEDGCTTIVKRKADGSMVIVKTRK